MAATCPHCSSKGRKLVGLGTGELDLVRCLHCTKIFHVCSRCHGRVADLAPNYRDMRCTQCNYTIRVNTLPPFGMKVKRPKDDEPDEHESGFIGSMVLGPCRLT